MTVAANRRAAGAPTYAQAVQVLFGEPRMIGLTFEGRF